MMPAFGGSGLSVAERSVELSPEAADDLVAIAQYIAKDNAVAAQLWIERLVSKARQAARHPLAGRVVPEWRDPAIREVFLRTYRIVYEVQAKRIIVLTIFEGHRLIGKRRK